MGGADSAGRVARAADLETIANSTDFAPAYILLSTEVLRTVGVWGMRDPSLWTKRYFLPLRDAFAFVVWPVNFFPEKTNWRGRRFYVREKQLVEVSAARKN
jgi:hypothetical protein